MKNKTITKGKCAFDQANRSFVIDLPEERKWVDLELWCDILSMPKLFDSISLTAHFADPTHGGQTTDTPHMNLKLSNMQRNLGLTRDSQEFRVPFTEFDSKENMHFLKDSPIKSIEVGLDEEGVAEFYYRVKELVNQ
ncbi:MAG: hypothetical protein QNK23_08045 [Crocinitomicaceae bacterium]|nr:hypothetical protein [Crocinitomicaceae bacterium]